MNISIAISVFPIIFIGELPDKTMFASLVMATRGRPVAVWLGAAGAFACHVVIAVSVGVALFRILPHRALELIVAGMFLAGAMLALREAAHERRHEQNEQERVAEEVRSHRQVIVASFVVVFLAEWGDLTQVLTANLAAHYHAGLSVGVGALLALWSVAALAVLGGRGLMRFIPIATVRTITAGVLLVLAIVTGWLAIA
jgi:putative Ca2+/H+ antiporter (TMEM165/GDT1 family)